MGKAVAHAERKSADLKFLVLVDLVHDGGRLNDFRECAIRFYSYDFVGGARVVPARSISALSRRNLMKAEPASRCGLGIIRAPRQVKTLPTIGMA
jgi:hypothetical protein